jgi:hypothetical protein
MKMNEPERKKINGRPKAKFKRDVIMSIRLSKEEQEVIRVKAEALKVEISTYMRQCSIINKIQYTVTDEDRDILRKLAGMANNINQIAKVCHRENLLNMENDIVLLRDSLSELINQVKP